METDEQTNLLKVWNACIKIRSKSLCGKANQSKLMDSVPQFKKESTKAPRCVKNRFALAAVKQIKSGTILMEAQPESDRCPHSDRSFKKRIPLKETAKQMKPFRVWKSSFVRKEEGWREENDDSNNSKNPLKLNYSWSWWFWFAWCIFCNIK